MAKKEETKVRDCKDCRYAISNNNKLYCKLQLQDENILKDSAIVDKKINCNYFKC